MTPTIEQQHFVGIFIDNDYKLMIYVRAESYEDAEYKLEKNFKSDNPNGIYLPPVRIVELSEDFMTIYNGR